MTRPPIAHQSSWNETEDITPEQRAELAQQQKRFDNIQNFDIVINDEEDIGYRNNGKYIYKDNAVYPLSFFPDMYGNLPEWVKVRKEDCGWSYFNDMLIDHNLSVPFLANEWDVVETRAKTPVQPFRFAYTYIPFTTKLKRKEDGAEAKINTSVLISAPWLGGPIDDAIIGPIQGTFDSRTGKYTYSETFKYKDNKTLKINYDKDSNGNKRLLEPFDSNSEKVIIPQSVIQQAEQAVNDGIFKSGDVIYFEAEGSCEFDNQELRSDYLAKVFVLPEVGKTSGGKSNKSTRKSTRKSNRKSNRKSKARRN
jgi:hypothetical protein